MFAENLGNIGRVALEEKKTDSKFFLWRFRKKINLRSILVVWRYCSMSEMSDCTSTAPLMAIF